MLFSRFGLGRFGIVQGLVLASLLPNLRFDEAYRSGRMHRRRRTTTYFADDLNGKRAVARRLRQIEAGSLRVENGLRQ